MSEWFAESGFTVPFSWIGTQILGNAFVGSSSPYTVAQGGTTLSYVHQTITNSGGVADYGNGILNNLLVNITPGWFILGFWCYDPSSSGNFTPNPTPNYLLDIGGWFNALGSTLWAGYADLAYGSQFNIPWGSMVFWTPNVLTIPQGTFVPKGSTSITANCQSPVFAHLKYNNGIGLCPKVGDSIVCDNFTKVANITGVTATGSPSNWNVKLTFDTPTTADWTVPVNSFVYTWNPTTPPDLSYQPPIAFTPKVGFSYSNLSATSAVSTNQTSLPSMTILEQTSSDNSGGAYGQGCLWSDKIPPQVGWFVWDVSVSAKEVRPTWTTNPNYIAATGGISSNQYNTVTLSQVLNTSLSSTDIVYCAPNVLTIPEGSILTAGSNIINVSSASPLFAFMGYQNGQGLYPHVGDTIMLDQLAAPATITSMKPISWSTDWSTWTVQLTLSANLASGLSAGSNTYAYTWNPNTGPDFFHSVDDDLPHSVPSGGPTPTAPVVPPNNGGTVIPPVIPGPPTLSGTVLFRNLQDVANYYNTYYPGFEMTYQPGIIPDTTVSMNQMNDFLTALGNCQSGWDGKTALPDITHVNAGDTVVGLTFKTPTALFKPALNSEFWAGDNGTSKNNFPVPAGCQYLHIQYLVGAGGAGGAADGSHDTGGDPWGGNAFGGGSGAWIEDVWIHVGYGDQISLYLGHGGGGTGGWGNPGEASTLSVTRNGTTYQVLSMGGGNGGMCNGGGWGDHDINTTGIGGSLIKTLGNLGSAGNWATRQQSHWGAHHVSNESDGRPGADSPFGSGGYGSGSANGFGAGGGGAGFVDGSHHHWSSGRAGGGNGSDGHARIDFMMYPAEGVTIFEINQ